MNTMIAARGASQPAQLTQTAALRELQLLTGVKAETWVGAPDEPADERAERLEFLADVMLGIEDGDTTKAGERATAARVAELHRLALGEPVDGPAVLFRYAHGDPVDWSAASIEAYDNIARTDQLDAEPTLRMLVGKSRSGKTSGYAAAVRNQVAKVQVA
ncbi:hypothetical protein AB0H07_39130 [Streptomyces sp. NPDC021354]|uniref:hypothetical protein n=1 Tax=Streptomyces sp. NPDC021354 TaxID=3154793 RepID=UPI0033FD08CB